MRTRLLLPDASGIAEAAAILRAGGLVAFPTETVYGLGANALDVHAVQAIFEAKRRPADDPLIIHLADAPQLDRVGVPNQYSTQLAERFWPGPLTLVVHRLPHVPGAVTAELATVAVRVPRHAVAQALLAASGLALAAPSANLFGRPSPTRPEHVLEDLDGRIHAIVDGGSTSVGVESTIVDLSQAEPRLLRPGGLPAEDIEAVLGVRLLPPPTRGNAGPMAAPGLMPMHYSPRTPLVLIVGPGARARLAEEVERAVTAGQRVGALCLDEDLTMLAQAARSVSLGSWREPDKAAARLFDALRALDADNLDILFTRELADPSIGLGRALADRLGRAAQRVVDTRH